MVSFASSRNNKKRSVKIYSYSISIFEVPDYVELNREITDHTLVSSLLTIYRFVSNNQIQFYTVVGSQL